MAPGASTVVGNSGAAAGENAVDLGRAGRLTLVMMQVVELDPTAADVVALVPATAHLVYNGLLAVQAFL